MANEKLARKAITVYSEIIRRLVNPTFSIPCGGSNIRKATLFIKRLEDAFGTVSYERLVDCCVATAYANRERPFSIGQLFGEAAIKRLTKNAHGVKYYENKWLKSKELSREALVAMIADRDKHPHAKYIYMPSEESTKERMLNLEVGFMICQISTLGWSPMSYACSRCDFVKQCKDETKRKFPELFRLRIDYETRK